VAGWQRRDLCSQTPSRLTAGYRASPDESRPGGLLFARGGKMEITVPRSACRRSIASGSGLTLAGSRGNGAISDSPVTCVLAVGARKILRCLLPRSGLRIREKARVGGTSAPVLKTMLGLRCPLTAGRLIHADASNDHGPHGDHYYGIGPLKRCRRSERRARSSRGLSLTMPNDAA